jgi:hypothetical protein
MSKGLRKKFLSVKLTALRTARILAAAESGMQANALPERRSDSASKALAARPE